MSLSRQTRPSNRPGGAALRCIPPSWKRGTSSVSRVCTGCAWDTSWSNITSATTIGRFRAQPRAVQQRRTALPISWGRIGPECLNLTVPSKVVLRPEIGPKKAVPSINLSCMRLANCRCLRCSLLVMCMHPHANKAFTLHLARSEVRERYFVCNLLHHKVLASFHQHLMTEAPAEQRRQPPTVAKCNVYCAIQQWIKPPEKPPIEN